MHNVQILVSLLNDYTIVHATKIQWIFALYFVLKNMQFFFVQDTKK